MTKSITTAGTANTAQKAPAAYDSSTRSRRNGPLVSDLLLAVTAVFAVVDFLFVSAARLSRTA